MISLTSILLVLWPLLSIVVVWYGFHLRNQILEKNTCKMTLTTKDKHKIMIESHINGFQLMKYISPASSTGRRGSKSALNPQPVLFIPGHLGDVDQVRSLASYDHNADQYFQYFSIDFGEDAVTAGHGKAILDHAIFVNDAILSIQKLYSNDTKILLIGHSLGGMVARAALLMSNSARDCPISNIILLNSPNTRSPYSPDSSLSKLFQAVNNGWKESLSMSADECFHMKNTSRRANARFRLLPCSSCLSSTRLISISGGAIDMMVHPDTMSVLHLQPFTRYQAKHGHPQPTASKDDQYSIINLCYSLVRLPVRWLYPVVPSNATIIEPVERIEAAYDTSIIGDAPIIKHDDIPLATSILDLRTSMLRGVEIPIDHQAILWCHQFLSSLSRSMKRLATNTTSSSTSTAWEEFFDLVPGVNTSYQHIFPSIADKLAYRKQWQTCDRQERMYMISLLQSSYDIVVGIIIEIFTTHLWKIIPCYLLLSSYIIISPSARLIAGYHDPTALPPSPSISSMLLFKHIFLQTSPYYHWNLSMMYATISRWHEATISNILFHPVILVVMLLGIMIPTFYDISTIYTTWKIDTIMLVSTILSWFVCYGVAMIARVVFASIFVTIRLALSWLRYIPGISMLSRHDPSSSSLSPIAWKDSRMVMFYGIVVLIAFFSRSMQRAATIPYNLPIYLYLLTILVLALITSITMNIFFMIIKSSNATILAIYQPLELMNFAMLYLLLIPLAYPMASFAMKVLLLQHDPISAQGYSFPLYNDMFCYGLFIQCLALACVFTHTIMLLNDKCFYDMKVKSSSWLMSYIGPLSDASYKHMHRSLALDDIDENSTCFHEDGGKYAIFEEVTDSSLCQEIKKNIILGSTYRVISCKCYADRSLKDMKEWCEWCTCKRCGQADKYPERTATREWRLLMLDATRYLLIAASITIYAFLLSNDGLHPYFMQIAMVALISVLRIVAEPFVFM